MISVKAQCISTPVGGKYDLFQFYYQRYKQNDTNQDNVVELLRMISILNDRGRHWDLKLVQWRDAKLRIPWYHNLFCAHVGTASRPIAAWSSAFFHKLDFIYQGHNAQKPHLNTAVCILCQSYCYSELIICKMHTDWTLQFNVEQHHVCWILVKQELNDRSAPNVTLQQSDINLSVEEVIRDAGAI